MGNESSEYLPLTSSPSESTARLRRYERDGWLTSIKARDLALLLVLAVQSIALVILCIALRDARASAPICPESGGNLLYSPAQNAVEWEIRRFTVGREHKTPYQGLSDDVDRAWGDLYNRESSPSMPTSSLLTFVIDTILRIPKSEAALLPNKTYPLKDDPGYYIAGLDVFHQLHCLNVVRKALNKEYYANDAHVDEEHVSHCVDSVRQSLMCNADISVNVWQWSDELKGVVGHSSQVHSCKNFDKLKSWAQGHRLRKWIDTRTYVPDGLPDPPVFS
ncbi:hypothetical protein BKA70DRAFT_1457224 [Coprinopsis sp. MPI-PUGE-AT-0042]|nr:hypothetical protein BKA70DRAFT_1457224 [Coprinopsis sp. MPI-PUGE-AT-0042]